VGNINWSSKLYNDKLVSMSNPCIGSFVQFKKLDHP